MKSVPTVAIRIESENQSLQKERREREIESVHTLTPSNVGIFRDCLGSSGVQAIKARYGGTGADEKYLAFLFLDIMISSDF